MWNLNAFIVQLWFQDNLLSMIIAISMVLTMIIAGLFGILVPFTLKKLNIDPAIASSVFVTTITDVIGFVSFLLAVGIIYLVLMRLLEATILFLLYFLIVFGILW